MSEEKKEEEKKKEVTGKAREEVHELHEAFEKMIVQAKPAGLEPPTPEPEKKKSRQEEKTR